MMVRKQIATAAAVMALAAASLGAMAQGVSNGKIDADVNKAVGTLNDMQKLGTQIKARQGREVAAQKAGERRTAVRKVAAKAANTVRRAAATTKTAAKNAGKAANKNANKKTNNKKKAGN